MRIGFRQAMTWLHGWSGLVLGWLLLAMCAAGTLSVWRQELDAWCHPELTRVPVDQAAAGAAAVRWLQGHAATAPAWFLDLADARSPGTLAFWGTAGGGYETRTLSPVTGSPTASRESLGGEFFYRFHFELELPYPWGRLLAATAAELLLTVLVTGIVAHRRIFKDFFTLRTAKGRRSWLDAHLVLGVLALPFHLAITVTGLVTLATLLLPWGGHAAYAGDTAAWTRDLYPAVARPHTGRPAPLAPMAPLLRAAAMRLGGAGVSTMAVIDPGDAAQLVTVSAGEGTEIAVQRHNLTFDGTTGRLLADHVERRPVMRAYGWLYGLHLARFADRVTRWLYFLSGLMLTGAVATGLILWTAKARRMRGFGFRLVDRLTIGSCAGLPAGFAAFLLANRVLPPDLPGRASDEVRALFAVWAAALLWAAVRPPRRGWVELLALAAWLAAAAALSDLLAWGLPGGPRAADGVTLGVDGALLVAAALLGWAARLVALAPVRVGG